MNLKQLAMKFFTMSLPTSKNRASSRTAAPEATIPLLNYLDNAATTPVRPEVLEAMLPYFSDNFGNPSSIYPLADVSKSAIDIARRQVATVLNCRPREVVFTSGGTEADNAALKGAIASRDRSHPIKSIVVSSIEHDAVLATAEALNRSPAEVMVSVVPVDKHGLVDPEAVARQVNKHTVLVSVMMVNNEVGTIQNIAKISELVKAKAKSRGGDVLVHTDAVQAAGKLSLDVEELGVDMLSLSAHKINGPKGVGALYVRRWSGVKPFQDGGGQEGGMRSGTENVPGIVGFGKAIELAEDERHDNWARWTEMKSRVVESLAERVEGIIFNGHPTQSVPSIVNFHVPGIEAEPVLVRLGMQGIAASSGSACSTSSMEPSHVLTAMGISSEDAIGALRLSFGRGQRTDDLPIEQLIESMNSVRGL
jgi:cysteine desulfurase